MDLSNDTVDAGDIGAGHEVTALDEITPVGSGAEQLSPLRYGDAASPPDARTDEVAHLRLRYKRPGEDDSRLITTPIARSSLRTAPSDTLRFAATVAAKRSEEHTSELQSLMRTSYAVFCLKK